MESGGYARAAKQLHKSQSTLTYAVQKLERLLGVKAFEIKGRKAQLTAAGQVLYRRGKALVEDAERLERAAGQLAAGWEPEIRLAVEIAFPTWLLLQCLGQFGQERPETRVELYEAVLGGTDEALQQGLVHFVVSPTVPAGFFGELLMETRFVPAAAPSHPLHQLGRPLGAMDLKGQRHLVIRETSSTRDRQTSVITNMRWIVSNKATSIRAATMGLGFAWYPEDSIREELSAGTLKVLPLKEGAVRLTPIYLVFADPDAAGPGARRLAEIIRERVKSACARANVASSDPAP